MDLLIVLIVMSVVTLLSIASLAPGGIGVSEVGISELLRAVGFSIGTAQGAALVIRIYGLYLAVLGGLHWALTQVFPGILRGASGGNNSR